MGHKRRERTEMCKRNVKQIFQSFGSLVKYQKRKYKLRAGGQ